MRNHLAPAAALLRLAPRTIAGVKQGAGLSGDHRRGLWLGSRAVSALCYAVRMFTGIWLYFVFPAAAMDAELHTSVSGGAQVGYFGLGLAAGPTLRGSVGLDYVLELQGKAGGFLRYGKVTGQDSGPGIMTVFEVIAVVPIRLSDRFEVKGGVGYEPTHVFAPWGDGYCCATSARDQRVVEVGLQVVHGEYGPKMARSEYELWWEQGGWVGSDAGWGSPGFRVRHRTPKGLWFGGEVAFGRIQVELGGDFAAALTYARLKG